MKKKNTFYLNGKLMILGMLLCFMTMGIVSGAEQPQRGNKLRIVNQTKRVLWPELEALSDYWQTIDNQNFSDRPVPVGKDLVYTIRRAKVGEYFFDGKLVGTRVTMSYADREDADRRALPFFYLTRDARGNVTKDNVNIDYAASFDGRDTYTITFTEK